MADGPFKGMAPDPDSAVRGRRAVLAGERHVRAIECEKCHGAVFEGDWPFCSGRPEQHER